MSQQNLNKISNKNENKNSNNKQDNEAAFQIDVKIAFSHDDIPNIWAMFKSGANSLKYGYRLENLSWRIWAAESMINKQLLELNDSSLPVNISSSSLRTSTEPPNLSSSVDSVSSFSKLIISENTDNSKKIKNITPNLTTTKKTCSNSDSNENQSRNPTVKDAIVYLHNNLNLSPKNDNKIQNPNLNTSTNKSTITNRPTHLLKRAKSSSEKFQEVLQTFKPLGQEEKQWKEMQMNIIPQYITIKHSLEDSYSPSPQSAQHKQSPINNEKMANSLIQNLPNPSSSPLTSDTQTEKSMPIAIQNNTNNNKNKNDNSNHNDKRILSIDSSKEMTTNSLANNQELKKSSVVYGFSMPSVAFRSSTSLVSYLKPSAHEKSPTFSNFSLSSPKKKKKDDVNKKEKSTSNHHAHHQSITLAKTDKHTSASSTSILKLISHAKSRHNMLSTNLKSSILQKQPYNQQKSKQNISSGNTSSWTEATSSDGGDDEESPSQSFSTNGSNKLCPSNNKKLFFIESSPSDSGDSISSRSRTHNKSHSASGKKVQINSPKSSDKSYPKSSGTNKTSSYASDMTITTHQKLNNSFNSTDKIPSTLKKKANHHYQKSNSVELENIESDDTNDQDNNTETDDDYIDENDDSDWDSVDDESVNSSFEDRTQFGRLTNPVITSKPSLLSNLFHSQINLTELGGSSHGRAHISSQLANKSTGLNDNNTTSNSPTHSAQLKSVKSASHISSVNNSKQPHNLTSNALPNSAAVKVIPGLKDIAASRVLEAGDNLSNTDSIRHKSNADSSDFTNSTFHSQSNQNSKGHPVIMTTTNVHFSNQQSSSSLSHTNRKGNMKSLNDQNAKSALSINSAATDSSNPGIQSQQIPRSMSTQTVKSSLSMSPRSVRRNMLASELSESLRRNLLWERQQKNVVNPDALKKRKTALDLPKLKDDSTQDDPQHSSSWAEFDEGYHARGW